MKKFAPKIRVVLRPRIFFVRDVPWNVSNKEIAGAQRAY